MAETVKYPAVEVDLIGCDERRDIVGRVRAALRAAGVTRLEMDEYAETALTGDLAHVLETTKQWVTVIGEPSV
jgi:hypothetical protein